MFSIQVSPFCFYFWKLLGIMNAWLSSLSVPARPFLFFLHRSIAPQPNDDHGPLRGASGSIEASLTSGCFYQVIGARQCKKKNGHSFHKTPNVLWAVMNDDADEMFLHQIYRSADVNVEESSSSNSAFVLSPTISSLIPRDAARVSASSSVLPSSFSI